MRTTSRTFLMATTLAVTTLAQPVLATTHAEVADRGAWWVEAQFADDGAVIGRTGTRDVPTTISATLAMVATGHRHATWEATLAYVQAGVEDYVGGGLVDDYGPAGSGDRPGALANLLLFADATGLSARDFGAHDLVARLEATEQDLGPDAGRFGQQLDVFGHTYAHATAVLALATTSDVDPSAAAVDHLLDLQCATGGFPSGYRSAAQRVTDDCTGDSNATGLALAALSLLGEDAAVSRAVGFLDDVRNDDGGWGYTPGDPTDGNSTGLVALGLRTAGLPVDDAVDALAALQFDCTADAGDVGGIRFVSTDAGPNTFSTYQGLLAFDKDDDAPVEPPCAPAHEASPVASAESLAAAPAAPAPLPVTGGGVAFAAFGALLGAALPRRRTT